VIGYCIAGKENPAALQGGEWHLPVKSLRTGRGPMDGHLAGKQWLDAESNPDIIFALKSVKDLKAEGEGKKSWTGTLEGDMTIHGVTKPITIKDATIAMVPASDDAAKGVKGDLMAIRAKYPVKLSDYGVSNQNIGSKVADELKLETSLYMSTVKPEDQPSKGEPGAESKEKSEPAAPDKERKQSMEKTDPAARLVQGSKWSGESADDKGTVLSVEAVVVSRSPDAATLRVHNRHGDRDYFLKISGHELSITGNSKVTASLSTVTIHSSSGTIDGDRLTLSADATQQNVGSKGGQGIHATMRLHRE
jgi:polyisoprenoid-binding protein YceI